MPTPFYHLSIAQELINTKCLPTETQCLITEHFSSFLFGNTAPDVQVLSGQERKATHFFSLPLKLDYQPPWELLLLAHPNLSEPECLTPSQVAFIVGYLCHIQADWIWIRDIFVPVFGPEKTWSTFSQRLYLHNVLRAYLDQQVLPVLPAETGQELMQAEPVNWLPFIAEADLRQWQTYLADQLLPGARARTVEVFTSRHGSTSQEFSFILSSEKRMNQAIFSRLTRQQINDYRQKLLTSSKQLICEYFDKNN